MLLNLRQITNEEKITFKKLAEEWLLYKKHQIKESTYFRYKYILNKYLFNIFDKMSVAEIKNLNINLIVDKLLEIYNSKTVRNIIGEFKSILSYGEKKYKINLNIDLIVLPKSFSKKITILTKYEEKKIRDFCFKSKELRDIGLLLCLYTGIRIGEICALTWKDIDLENGLIRINKTMERIYIGNKNTVIYIGEPKSKSSIRIIPIANSVLNLIKKLKNKNNYTDDSFFLSGSKSKIIEPRNYQYWFKKRLQMLNIPINKFHILRHTFATNCIQIGMDVKSLSEMLGHSSVNVTLNRYVHSSYEIQKFYLEKL